MRGLWQATRRRAPLARRWAYIAGVAALATLAMSLAATSSPARTTVSHAAEAVPDLNPEPPRLAYVTETAAFASQVWIASASGGEAKLLGPGQQPLIAPDGQLLAASLFGVVPGIEERGPAIGVYPASGGPVVDT